MKNAVTGTASSKKRARATESSSTPKAKVARINGHVLSSAQLKELEKKLQELQVELKTAIHGRAQTVVSVSAGSESLIRGDDAEVAEKQRVSNAALQELDILKNRLFLVQRAIAKIRAGVYGICEETEEPIGYERLVAVPWARYAVHVQEIRERKLRDFKYSKLRSEA